MSRWNKVLAVAGAAALCFTANGAMAGRGGGGNGGGGGGGAGGGFGGGRGGGNFDPAAMRQRQLDNYKDQLEVADDSEWKVIEPTIGKVLDARDELRTAQSNGGFGRGGRGGGGPGGTNGNNNNNNNNNNNGGGRRQRGNGPTISPEAEALQSALDAKASPEELKAKLARLRDMIKQKEEKLTAAQAELQKLLSTRQEATAVLDGLLK